MEWGRLLPALFAGIAPVLPTLIGIAAECGLRAYEVAFAQSEHEALRGIDLRRPEDGVSMYMECVRART